MPSRKKRGATSDKSVDDLAEFIFEMIQKGGEQNLARLINEKFAPDFKEMAPMETHFKILGSMHKELKEGTLEAIMIEGDELILHIKTKKSVSELIVGLAMDKQKRLMVAGMMVEN